LPLPPIAKGPKLRKKRKEKEKELSSPLSLEPTRVPAAPVQCQKKYEKKNLSMRFHAFNSVKMLQMSFAFISLFFSINILYDFEIYTCHVFTMLM
jgi:hypothetical protein